MYYVLLNIASMTEDVGGVLKYHPWPMISERISENCLMDVKNALSNYINSHKSFEMVDMYVSGRTIITIVSLTELEYNRIKLTGILDWHFPINDDTIGLTMSSTIVERISI